MSSKRYHDIIFYETPGEVQVPEYEKYEDLNKLYHFAILYKMIINDIVDTI